MCIRDREYNQGLIKKHELTHPEKENDRTLHIEITNANTGPVFLTFRNKGEFQNQISNIINQKKELESFLMQNVYRHPSVMEVRDHAQQVLRSLFNRLIKNEELLPQSFQQRAEEMGLERTICDYLAGMTDRFAWREHARLCGD